MGTEAEGQHACTCTQGDVHPAECGSSVLGVHKREEGRR